MLRTVEMIKIEFFADDNGIEPFTDWFESLKDMSARIKIRQKLDRMTKGNFGNVEPVGGGISEAKIDYGPGYRIYFAKLGTKKVLILYGGDKSTQGKDIKKSQIYYKQYQMEKR
jgi:putative addiction module killer protein